MQVVGLFKDLFLFFIYVYVVVFLCVGTCGYVRRQKMELDLLELELQKVMV